MKIVKISFVMLTVLYSFASTAIAGDYVTPEEHFSKALRQMYKENPRAMTTLKRQDPEMPMVTKQARTPVRIVQHQSVIQDPTSNIKNASFVEYQTDRSGNWVGHRGVAEVNTGTLPADKTVSKWSANIEKATGNELHRMTSKNVKPYYVNGKEAGNLIHLQYINLMGDHTPMKLDGRKLIDGDNNAFSQAMLVWMTVPTAVEMRANQLKSEGKNHLTFHEFDTEGKSAALRMGSVYFVQPIGGKRELLKSDADVQKYLNMTNP